MKKTKQSSLDISLLEEMTQLEYFVVKKPLNTPEFWAEWQEKYSRASIAITALKKIARMRKLTQEEYAKLRTMLMVYEDILKYLENLKNVALNLKGVYSSFNFEFDDDEDEIDF